MKAMTAADEVWLDAFRFTNDTPVDRLLWLEPWANEFLLAPGAELTLWTHGSDEPLEIEHTPDALVVYAPSGMRIRVDVDGVVQSSGSAEHAFPDLGITPRALMELAFSDFPEARLAGRVAPPRRSWWQRLFGRD